MGDARVQRVQFASAPASTVGSVAQVVDTSKPYGSARSQFFQRPSENYAARQQQALEAAAQLAVMRSRPTDFVFALQDGTRFDGAEAVEQMRELALTYLDEV